jgi:hypothetical protein
MFRWPIMPNNRTQNERLDCGGKDRAVADTVTI